MKQIFVMWICSVNQTRRRIDHPETLVVENGLRRRLDVDGDFPHLHLQDLVKVLKGKIEVLNGHRVCKLSPILAQFALVEEQ